MSEAIHRTFAVYFNKQKCHSEYCFNDVFPRFLRVPVINFDASRSESNSSNLYLPTLAVKQAAVVDKGWTFFLRPR